VLRAFRRIATSAQTTLDADAVGDVAYEEIVPEIADQLNHDASLAALRAVV
jgi:hypothetical protein